MSHHKMWPPSGADRWVDCTASPKLLAALPEDREAEATKYSAEGTLAHSVLDAFLSTGEFDDLDVGTVHRIDGFDVEVTEEMHECAKWAQSYIDSFLGTRSPNRLSECKVTVKLPVFDESGEEIAQYETTGTADVLGVADAGSTILHVFDYKFGKGVAVAAKGNRQTMIYAMGALDTYDFYFDREFKHVCMHIVQPRISRKPEPHTITVEDLEDYRREFALRAHESTVKHGSDHYGVFRPDPLKTCRWCPMRGRCQPLEQHMSSKVIAEFDDLDGATPNRVTLPDPHSMSGDRMADVLDLSDGLTSWLSAVATEANKRLNLDPDALGGRYKLVAGRRGNREWEDPKAVEEILTKARAGEAMWDRKLVSPTKAEKALTKGRWAKVADMVTQSEGKPTVVPAEDKRPAIAAIGFDDLEDNGLLD